VNCDGSKLQQGLLTSLKSMLCVGNSHVNKVLRGIGNSNNVLRGKKSHEASVRYNSTVQITQGACSERAPPCKHLAWPSPGCASRPCLLLDYNNKKLGIPECRPGFIACIEERLTKTRHPSLTFPLTMLSPLHSLHILIKLDRAFGPP
jgi:hypothetical protein